MLEIGLGQQVYQASSAFLVGIGAGVLYDVLKTIRRHTKSTLSTLLLDALFWVLITLALFWQTMTIGGGQLRLFMLIVNGVACVVYFVVLSRAVLSILENIFRAVRRGVDGLIMPVKRTVGRGGRKIHRKMREHAKKSLPFLVKWYTMRKKPVKGSFATKNRAKGRRRKTDETQTDRYHRGSDYAGGTGLYRNQPSSSRRAGRCRHRPARRT